MMDATGFEAQLREILERRYHHHHPFNRRMHEGNLEPREIRCWVRNRYYYQTRIPIKDATILAKAPAADFRRAWIQRIRDHDGDGNGADGAGEGGLAQWLALAEAVGLDRAEVAGLSGVLPGVRRACDAYVALVTQSDLLAAVAASLTELQAGALMEQRIEAFARHYPWVDTAGLRYFRGRTEIAPRDAAFGLRFVVTAARDAEQQQRCAAALERKCEILWSLLDAVEDAGRRPALREGALLREDDRELGRWLAVLPERAIRMNVSGREILTRCDGRRRAEEIAADLQALHPGAPEVTGQVHEFLDALRRHGALEFRD